MTHQAPLTFIWPEMLWAMLAVPLLVAGYFWLLARRKKTVLRYASLGLVRQAMAKTTAWRRHVPPALLLLATISLLFATSRPAALITLPSAQKTIVLAIDVSGSMRATDVKPNRITAAQEAAKTFVADLPRSVRVAVVSFAGTAAVVQPGDRESWFRAWTELGARCDAEAERAARFGHDESASDAYLRAANYRFAGLAVHVGQLEARAADGRHSERRQLRLWFRAQNTEVAPLIIDQPRG